MLLQNITLNNQYPYRRSGATATATETGYMPSQHGSGGPRQFQRWMAFGVAESLPTGYNPGIFMPRRHSQVASFREAVVTFASTGVGISGMPGVGTADMSFDATGEGSLLASSSGLAECFFDTSEATVVGTILGVGLAESVFDATGSIGAIANMTGVASATFDGTLTPYAVGMMEGTTDVQTELTTSSIAAAILGATASEWNESGTIGNKINTASSGGVDLDALADAVWDKTVEAGTSAEEMLRILASVLAGKVSGAGTGTETFKGIDGTTSRVVSTVDDDGNRTEVFINAA